MNKFNQEDYPKGAKGYPGDRLLGKGKKPHAFPASDPMTRERRPTGTKQPSIPQPVATFSGKKKFAR